MRPSGAMETIGEGIEEKNRTKEGEENEEEARRMNRIMFKLTLQELSYSLIALFYSYIREVDEEVDKEVDNGEKTRKGREKNITRTHDKEPTVG